MEKSAADTQARFEHTHWSIVLPAARQNVPEAQSSLGQLCQIYWPSIHSFLRRQGQTSENAKDLTQGFFAQLLAGDQLGSLNPAAGKFRSFLLTCLNNYVRNERDKQNAEMSDGRQVHFPLNFAQAETNQCPACGVKLPHDLPAGL